MSAFHSTNLALVNRHCPRALDFYEAHTPYPREMFAAGVAAHAVLQSVGEVTNKENRELTSTEVRDVAQAITLALIAHGRSYDKHPEPPTKPDAAFAGRDLALDWLAFNPIHPGAMYEVGLALDAKGSPVPYWSDDARLRTILDVVRIADEADEESSRTVLIVTDYKSAWSADESELETLQRKIQALVAWKVYGEHSGATLLRMEVANLRLQKVYSAGYWAEDGLREKVASWTRDVLSTCAALDEQKRIGKGKRPAIPGAGCYGCPYLQACPDAQNYMEMRGEFRSPEKRAVAYAVATAMREELAEQLRMDTEEGPIEIEKGIVGTVAQERREATADAHEELWAEWEGAGGDAVGLLKAMKPTTGNIANVAKVLYADRKERAEREKLIEALTKPKMVREFGIFDKPRTSDEAKGTDK